MPGADDVKALPFTPRDKTSPATYPVSVKGVLVRDGKVLLAYNERDEWELPGGRIEVGESPEQCVVREFREETGLPVVAAEIVDVWIYHVDSVGKDVLIVTYGCVSDSRAAPAVSSEHQSIGEFPLPAVADLPMPEGYKRSITRWAERLHVNGSNGRTH